MKIEPYYALLITVGKHANNQKSLPAAVGEAEKFEKTLHQFGYTTHFLKDEQVTKSKVFDAVEQIPYPSPNESSQLIVYFSGHGYAIGDIVQQLYLATYDMKNQESIGKLISFNELKMAVSLRGYTQVLFILDCCCAGLVYNAVKNGTHTGSSQHQASSSTFEEYKLPCTLAFLATDSVRDVFDKVFTPALVHSLKLCLQSNKCWSVYQVQETCSAAAREISETNPVLYSTVPRHPVVQRLNIVETGEFTFMKSQKLGRRIASPEASSTFPQPKVRENECAASTSTGTSRHATSPSSPTTEPKAQAQGQLFNNFIHFLGNSFQSRKVDISKGLEAFFGVPFGTRTVVDIAGRKVLVTHSQIVKIEGEPSHRHSGTATDIKTGMTVEVEKHGADSVGPALQEKFENMAREQGWI